MVRRGRVGKCCGNRGLQLCLVPGAVLINFHVELAPISIAMRSVTLGKRLQRLRKSSLSGRCDMVKQVTRPKVDCGTRQFTRDHLGLSAL